MQKWFNVYLPIKFSGPFQFGEHIFLFGGACFLQQNRKTGKLHALGCSCRQKLKLLDLERLGKQPGGDQRRLQVNYSAAYCIQLSNWYMYCTGGGVCGCCVVNNGE